MKSFIDYLYIILFFFYISLVIIIHKDNIGLNDLPIEIRSSEFYRDLADNNDSLSVEKKIYYYSLAALSNPIDYLSKYNLAITLWKNNGSAQEIIQLLKEANYLYPANDKIVMQIGLFYLSKSEIDKAIDYFKKSAEINKNNLPYIYEKINHLGDSYVNSVTPQNCESLMHLVNYYLNKRNYETAAHFLKEAFNYAKQEEKLSIIQRLLDLNQLSVAEPLIKKIENQIEEKGRFYWLYAQFYLLKNESKNFSQMFEKAIKAFSQEYSNDVNKLNNSYIEIAEKLLKYNMIQSAELLYRRVQNQDFYNAKANEGLAKCYFLKKDLYKAFLYASRAEENLSNQQFILSIYREALKEKDEAVIREIRNYLKIKHLTSELEPE